MASKIVGLMSSNIHKPLDVVVQHSDLDQVLLFFFPFKDEKYEELDDNTVLLHLYDRNIFFQSNKGHTPEEQQFIKRIIVVNNSIVV